MREGGAAYHPNATDELAYQIINLRILCQMYHQGYRTLYKPAVVVMRTLLLGDNQDPAVVLQLPNPKLPRLLVANVSTDGMHFTMPCEVRLANVTVAPGVGLKNVNFADGAVNRMELGSPFAPELIPLSDWLGQPFLRGSLTVREFIRHVANKDGGAHFEDGNEYVATYEDCASIHWPLTARIGEAVADALWTQFEGANPEYKIRIP